jgi:hypothetical protein
MCAWRLAPFVAVLGCAIATPTAMASSTQELLVQDDHRLLELSQGEQAAALDHLRDLGVDRVRVGVWWRRAVRRPTAKRRPPGNPSDPRSRIYRPGYWAILDSLVRGARGHGIAVTLNPAAASGLPGTPMQIPRWAQGRGRSPEAAEFAHFARALGRRYSGSFAPRGDQRPLPPVRDWSLWNEPNNPQFLTPQWRRVGGEWIAWSPVVYRRLYVRGARALRATGHGRDRIYLGETAAVGALQVGRRQAPIAPGLFVRELACVDRGFEPYEGGEARRRGCARYRRLDADGLATHLYSSGSGTAPAVQVFGGDLQWVPADPSRPARLLERLAAAGALPADLDVLNTEAGFQSHPARPWSLKESTQAFELNLAEYLQWREPSVDSFAQYLLMDDPVWFTGLRYIDGRAKDAFAAFRMPILVRQVGTGILGLPEVAVWGAAYGRGAGRPVRVLRDGIPAATVVPQNRRGYFEVLLPALRPGATFRLEDPRTGARSRLATVTPGI